MPLDTRRLKVADRASRLRVTMHRVADRHQSEISATCPAMRAQVLRASDAIAYNILAAAAHDTPPRMAAQLMIAIASCNALEIQLKLGDALGVLGTSGPSLITEVQEIRMMLYGLRKRVLHPPAA